MSPRDWLALAGLIFAVVFGAVYTVTGIRADLRAMKLRERDDQQHDASEADSSCEPAQSTTRTLPQ